MKFEKNKQNINNHMAREKKITFNNNAEERKEEKNHHRT